MKVYISGKIGEEVISEATRQKFAKAEAMLLAKGYEVVNVTSFEQQASLMGYLRMMRGFMPEQKFDRYTETLLWCLFKLRRCDAVFFLYDWIDSPGAIAEHKFAKATQKKMLWESWGDAQLFNADNERPEDVWLPIAGKEGGV